MMEGQCFIYYVNAMYLYAIHYMNIAIYNVNLFNVFFTLIYFQSLIPGDSPSKFVIIVDGGSWLVLLGSQSKHWTVLISPPK